MCAILDASVCSRVFGSNNRPDAGKEFFKWVDEGRGRLVIGGRLRVELFQNDEFRRWATTAIQYGRLKNCDDTLVDQCENTLNDLVSNDSHIIALAIESHARLLCTDDNNLMKDFKNRELIRNPRGTIFSIKPESKFDRKRRGILQRCNCKM